MGTIIKIIAGMVVGVLATWFFIDAKSTSPNSEGSQPHSSKVAQLEQSSDSTLQVEEQKGSSETREELTEKVTELARELQRTQQELKTAVATKEAAIEELKSSLASKSNHNPESNSEESSHEKSSGKDDYVSGIPEKHRNLLTPSEVKTAYDRHKDFVDETEDVAWSLEKEQQITSYIQGHPRGAEVTLDLVKCKKTMCEVYGSIFSQDDKALSTISNGMRSQPWWDFIGSSSSSTSAENGSSLFVIILHTNF